jgi:hypothetical protein
MQAKSQGPLNPAETNIKFPQILSQNTAMATLSLTHEQVVHLVKQLPWSLDILRAGLGPALDPNTWSLSLRFR